MLKVFLIILKLKKCVCMHLKNYLIYYDVFLIDIRLTKIYDKAILENGGTLKSVSYSYKNQEMCNKEIYIYPNALEFVPEGL